MIKFAMQNKTYKVYLAYILFCNILNIAQNIVFVRIGISIREEKEYGTYAFMYFLLILIDPILDYVREILKNDASTSLFNSITTKNIKMWKSLPISLKETNPFDEYMLMVKRSTIGIINIYLETPDEILDVVSSIISIFVSIDTITKFFTNFVIFLLGGLYVYFFQIKTSKEFFKKDREMWHRLLAKSNMAIFHFSREDMTTNKLMETLNSEYFYDTEVSLFFIKRGMSYKVIHALLVGFCLFTIDPINLIISLALIQKAWESIKSLSINISKNQRLYIDYQSLTEFWKKHEKSCRKKVVQVDIKGPVDVLGKIIIEKTPVDKLVVGSTSRLTINPKSSYLIRGRSGSGKSTFIKGILGQHDGLKLSGVDHPSSYSKSICYVSQDICEKIKWSKLTINDLFNNSHSDHIKKAFRIANCKEWLDTYGDDFDRELGSHPSGGEKSRIAIAMRVCEALKNSKLKWLIFDEAEKGLDAELAYDVIKNIRHMFNDRTLIFISHLERIHKEFKWSQIYNVDNGKVSPHFL